MRVTPLISMILLTAVLGGCGYNVKTIQSFDASTKSLTKNFNEMAKGTEERCINTFIVNGLMVPRNNDYIVIKKNAETHCKEYISQNKTARMISDIVSGYSSALSSLAALDPEYMSDDISALEKAAAELKKSDETPEFKAADLAAASKLAAALATAYTRYKIKHETLNVIREHKDLVNANVAKMSLYGSRVYRASFEIQNAPLTQALDRLKQASKSTDAKSIGTVIPHRLAQRDFYEALSVAGDERLSDEREKIISDFVKACNALITANNELAEKFESLPKDEQLKAVVDFSKDARVVRDSLKAMHK